MDAHMEQQVRERAFQLWEMGAMQGATDLDYWVAAESEVKAKLSTKSVVLAGEAGPAKVKKARTTKVAEKAPAKASAKAKK